MAEDITEAALEAYVDGQLDTAERIAVESWLQRHPEVAARVLEDLRLKDELKLWLGEEDTPPPPRSIALARELARRLHRRTLGLRLRRGLVAAVLVAAGWFGHQEFELFVDQVAAAPSAPDYAEEAAEAFAVLQIKRDAGVTPDPKLLTLPAQAGGFVRVPELGADLRFLGSDLVPWDGGIALVALYEAGGHRLVTLFAAESASFAVAAPRAAPAHGLPTAFWQDGRFAYAINGELSEAELLALAEAAAARPHATIIDHPPHPGGIHG